MPLSPESTRPSLESENHRGDRSRSGPGAAAVALSAAGFVTCAVLDNATLKCWGHNSSGQLGLGDVAPRGDNAGEMGNNLLPVDVGLGRTVTAVASGTAHTCALLDNATVKCWGLNNFGQLGLGDVASRGDGPGEMGDSLPAVDLGIGPALKVKAGQNHACAQLDNVALKCWGYNFEGQLGLGDTANRGDDAGEMGTALPPVDF